jgi:hypothetical protein
MLWDVISLARDWTKGVLRHAAIANPRQVGIGVQYDASMTAARPTLLHRDVFHRFSVHLFNGSVRNRALQRLVLSSQVGYAYIVGGMASRMPGGSPPPNAKTDLRRGQGLASSAPANQHRFLKRTGSPAYHLLLAAVAIFILGPLGGVSAAFMNFSISFFISG